MPENNLSPPCSERLGSLDVSFLSQSKDLGSNQPAGSQPAGGANQEYERNDRDVLPHRQNQEKQEESRDGKGPVHKSHEDRVHSSSPVPRDQADGSPDSRRKSNRKYRDTERYSRAGDYSREDVAIELVGPERMTQAGWQATGQNIGLRRWIGQKHRAQRRRQSQECQNDRAESTPRITPDFPQAGGNHAKRTRGSRSAYATSVSKPPATTRAATN